MITNINSKGTGYCGPFGTVPVYQGDRILAAFYSGYTSVSVTHRRGEVLGTEVGGSNIVVRWDGDDEASLCPTHDPMVVVMPEPVR